MIVSLQRFAYTPVGVFGRIYLPEFQCFTVERPWLGNAPRVSCIPIGKYKMQLGKYNRGGYPAWEVKGVPGRSLIKIHRGNTMHNLLGCIAPGLALAWVESPAGSGATWAVSSSTQALDDFMRSLGEPAEVSIEITNTTELGDG